jgi:nitroreductase
MKQFFTVNMILYYPHYLELYLNMIIEGGKMDTLEAIKNRRSIRKYKEDPIDENTLNIVLDAARLAPSWANTQCWKFIVVRDNSTKVLLADTIISPPHLESNPAAKAVISAPVLIVACAEKRVSGYFNGKAATDKGEFWYMFDVALAMQSLSLAATSIGLGTVHIGLFDIQKVSDILGIPDNYCVVEMTPLGYPEYQPKQRPRKELTEVVFYEKFGGCR